MASEEARSRPMRLFSKQLLVAGVPLLCVGLAATWVTEAVVVPKLRTAADNSARQELALSRARIESFFEQRTRVLETIARTDVVQGGRLEDVLPYLAREEVTQKDTFEGLYFDGLDGVVHPARGATFSVADRPYFAAVRRGEHVSQVISSRATGRRVLLEIVPVHAGDGRLVGALAGTVLLDQLLASVAQRRLDLPAAPVLVASDGTVLASALSDAELAPLRDALRERAPGHDRFVVGSVVYVVRSTRLEPVGWTLVLVAREAALLGAVDAFEAGTLVGLAVALAVALALAAAMTRAVLRPVTALVAAHRTFGEGHTEARVEPSGDGELRELAESFQDMARRIRESEAQKARDEDERRQLEHKLAQAQKMDGIGRLAGGVAHDFNNLLTVILGLTDLVLEKEDLSPSDRELLEAVRQAAVQASGLTRQLLAFARKQVAEPRVVAPDRIVRDCERMLRRLLPENVELQVELGARSWCTRIDPAQLAQILVNLAVNARDAMPDGGKLTLETAQRTLRAEDESDELPAGEYVELSVADTGTGLSDEARAHLFEPFFTTKPRGQGTGLGLATCYGIVTQCGGSVCVRSERGRGTCFQVRLPRVLAPEDADRPLDRGFGTSADLSRRCRVLLVEDDGLVRATTALMLRARGYEVSEAVDGEDALARVRQAGPYDVLVTDSVMPRLGGAALARALRRSRKDLPVLFLSGHVGDNDPFGPGLEGASFLAKPFTATELVSKVEQVMTRERQVEASHERALAAPSE